MKYIIWYRCNDINSAQCGPSQFILYFCNYFPKCLIHHWICYHLLSEIVYQSVDMTVVADIYIVICFFFYDSLQRRMKYSILSLSDYITAMAYTSSEILSFFPYLFHVVLKSLREIHHEDKLLSLYIKCRKCYLSILPNGQEMEYVQL